jgi:hypothetical protein
VATLAGQAVEQHSTFGRFVVAHRTTLGLSAVRRQRHSSRRAESVTGSQRPTRRPLIGYERARIAVSLSAA